MITIAALMGAKNFPQVKAHLEIGKAHGITKTEAVEIVTQLGFYTGWPNAWTVFPMIEEIYADEEEDIHGGIFGMGDPNDAYAEFFVGQSYLKPIAINEDIPTFVGNVTFEPGCRNNWHIHKASKGGGQILIGVEGEGWYQEEGKEALPLYGARPALSGEPRGRRFPGGACAGGLRGRRVASAAARRRCWRPSASW